MEKITFFTYFHGFLINKNELFCTVGCSCMDFHGLLKKWGLGAFSGVKASGDSEIAIFHTCFTDFKKINGELGATLSGVKASGDSEIAIFHACFTDFKK